jgi:hypothetical protein
MLTLQENTIYTSTILTWQQTYYKQGVFSHDRKHIINKEYSNMIENTF